MNAYTTSLNMLNQQKILLALKKSLKTLTYKPLKNKLYSFKIDL